MIGGHYALPFGMLCLSSSSGPPVRRAGLSWPYSVSSSWPGWFITPKSWTLILTLALGSHRARTVEERPTQTPGLTGIGSPLVSSLAPVVSPGRSRACRRDGLHVRSSVATGRGHSLVLLDPSETNSTLACSTHPTVLGLEPLWESSPCFARAPLNGRRDDELDRASAGNPPLPWDVIGTSRACPRPSSFATQWVLLCWPPWGGMVGEDLPIAAPGLTRSWLAALSDRRTSSPGSSVFLSWSVVHGLGNYRRFDIADPDAEAIPLPPLASGVISYDGADPDAAPPETIWASLDGLIRQGGLEEEQMPPVESGGRLHWTIRDGQPHAAPEDVDIGPSLDAWTVSGSPGDVVVLAQRATPGWRCEGAKLIDDKTLLDPARHEELFAWSWLTVESVARALAVAAGVRPPLSAAPSSSRQAPDGPWPDRCLGGGASESFRALLNNKPR